jgi:hypothetical protein
MARGGKESSSVGWKRDQREEESLDNWGCFLVRLLADGKSVEGEAVDNSLRLTQIAEYIKNLSQKVEKLKSSVLDLVLWDLKNSR